PHALIAFPTRRSSDLLGLIVGRTHDGIQPSMSRKRLLVIVLTILALLHLYIGARLLPDLPVQPFSLQLGALYLALSLCLIPLGLVRKSTRLNSSHVKI